MATRVAGNAPSQPSNVVVAATDDSNGTAAPADFERLREILIGDERRALDAAHARIEKLENTQNDLAQRLPGALEAVRSGSDTRRMANALIEPVELALGTAVKKSPQTLVDALFPIIGPLIRKAIAEALRNLVADLNSAVESSLSPRGLKWRIEAWRAGVPYAQVVLKHRLTYRIDHVFLSARESGLVLQHQSAPDMPELDADAIAGMLTALGDFVSDSVGGKSGDTLDSFRVGEYLVWVVQGPRANLSCFMRGVPPASLRGLLEQRLEDIHAQFSGVPDKDLRAAGDVALRHEWLQPTTLLSEAGVASEPTQTRPSRWPALLVVLAIAFAIGWSAISRERWHARIEALRAQLNGHAGFVLTGIEARPWRAVTVHGLLDPDAAPLAPEFGAAELGAVTPTLVTAGYLSSDDAIVARRAERLLAPPADVRFAVKQGVLTITGNAPSAWIADAREHAGWIAGVNRIEWALTPQTDLVAVARAQLQDVLRTLPTLRIAFVDATQPVAGTDVALDAIAAAARHAIALAVIANVELAMTSVGTTDDSGSPAANEQLRAERAQWLALALAARGIGKIEVGSAASSNVAGEDQRGAHLRATVQASPP
ncbi:MAG: hypothetical protein ABI082_11685 [Dokdonella sp.]